MKTCPQCGIEFSNPKHPNSTYCCYACYIASVRIIETRTCPGCGTKFESKVGKRQKYCNPRCGFDNRPRPPRTAIKHCVCEFCGIEFETFNCRPGRFCSSSCRSKFGARQPKPRNDTEYVTLYCEICNKEFVELKSYYLLRGRKCCSKKCGFEKISRDRVGAGNPQYSGGTKFPDRGSSWTSQRKKALTRDGNACRICGLKKGNRKRVHIDVHHIVPYSEFNNDHVKANELSNLITLCRRCHTKVEHYDFPCPIPMF